MYKIMLKEMTDENDANYTKFRVIELHNNVMFRVGEYITKDEVKRLTFKPGFKVVVK